MGTGKGTGKPMCTRFVETTLCKLPLSFFPDHAGLFCLVSDLNIGRELFRKSSGARLLVEHGYHPSQPITCPEEAWKMEKLNGHWGSLLIPCWTLSNNSCGKKIVNPRSLLHWDPTDQLQESKAALARKVKKESPGVPAKPPKRVKNDSPEDSASQKSPVF